MRDTLRVVRSSLVLRPANNSFKRGEAKERSSSTKVHIISDQGDVDWSLARSNVLMFTAKQKPKQKNDDLCKIVDAFHDRFGSFSGIDDDSRWNEFGMVCSCDRFSRFCFPPPPA